MLQNKNIENIRYISKMLSKMTRYFQKCRIFSISDRLTLHVITGSSSSKIFIWHNENESHYVPFEGSDMLFCEVGLFPQQWSN